MSCNYAEGLSPYENKGILGVPEKFEDEAKVEEKCEILFNWLKSAKHVVVHTGAGISTSAGIPDFRGPKGVWTLEKQGKKPDINISFNEAQPTKTHMALKALVDLSKVHFIISQNIDGLHLKSGVERNFLAELHGNMFTDQCNTCGCQIVRREATTTVGKKVSNRSCPNQRRPCRGKLCDTILDWEHSLPDADLEISDYHSSIADLNICLGTTLQIVPSGNLPLKCKRFGGKVVIVNLQPTKHDKKADLIINTYVDKVLERIFEKMDKKIPEYSPDLDPTKKVSENYVIEWNLAKKEVIRIKKLYDQINKDFKRRKMELHQNGVMKKIKRDLDNVKTEKNSFKD